MGVDVDLAWGLANRGPSELSGVQRSSNLAMARTYTPSMTVRLARLNLSALVASMLLLLAAPLSFALTQNPPGPPPPPQPGGNRFPASTPASPVRVEPPVIELGVVPPNTEHRRTFRIVNDGPIALKVLAANPSCRCTTVDDIVGKSIPAGGSIDLEAVFAAPPTPGYKDATVNIVIEGVQRPLTAKIGGDVTLPIRVDPPFVDGLKGRVAGSIALTSIDGKPFTILSSGGRAPTFDGPAPQGPQSAQRITWNIAGIACERMPLWWIVVTDHPDCPIVPLRIRHDCTGSKADMARYARYWIPKEQLVNLGRMASGGEKTEEFQIDHYNPRGRGAIVRRDWGEVRSVSTGTPDLSVRLLGTRPAGDGSVVLSLGFTAKPGFSGLVENVLRVETASGVAEIPLVAVVGG